MEKKRIFLIITVIIVVVVAGFFLINQSQPITITQPPSSFYCEDMYDEIENDLDRANYCQSDSDCSVIMLGGWYVDFGCYHFINKDVDQEQFFTKMDAYKKKCSLRINDCASAPDAKCISNKCVYVE